MSKNSMVPLAGFAALHPLGTTLLLDDIPASPSGEAGLGVLEVFFFLIIFPSSGPAAQ